MLTIEFNEPKIARRWLTPAKRYHYPHDKPAITRWYNNGQKHYEAHYLRAQLHRDDDKPAITYWCGNGQKDYEAYYLIGKCHRENDKPAYTG